MASRLHNPSGGLQTPQIIAPDTLANIGLPVKTVKISNKYALNLGNITVTSVY
ncbi:MAG: hypothetical protein ABL933_12665 [Methyloglobulus sp.]